MTLKELENQIGIEKDHPEMMEEIYLQKLSDSAPACDLALIDALQEEHELFGDYHMQVRQVAEQVNGDPLRSLWVKTASSFVLQADDVQAQQLPLPTADDTQISRMLPLFAVLPQIPLAVEEYRRRQYPAEEMYRLLRGYRNGLKEGAETYGYPCYTADYKDWLVYICKVRLFWVDKFRFDIMKAPADALYLQNKETCEICPVMMPVTMVSDGKHILGVDGYERAEDTFQVTFREDAEIFYGHGVANCVVSQNEEVFSKGEWNCILRPGENCLGMHIGGGADMTPENVASVIATARDIAASRFAEFGITQIYCDSWLLDPQLGQLAGENTKMAAFMRSFAKHPIRGSGLDALGYVFSGDTADYASLPENTTLQRNMKKHYINGGYVYFTAGVYCK